MFIPLQTLHGNVIVHYLINGKIGFVRGIRRAIQVAKGETHGKEALFLYSDTWDTPSIPFSHQDQHLYHFHLRKNGTTTAMTMNVPHPIHLVYFM